MVTKASKTAAPVVTARLYPALPNPFSESTCVTFEILGERAPWRMELTREDGGVVRAFEGIDSGPISIIWHGDNQVRDPLPSGTYWCRVVCGIGEQRRRIHLIR